MDNKYFHFMSDKYLEIIESKYCHEIKSFNSKKWEKEKFEQAIDRIAKEVQLAQKCSLKIIFTGKKIGSRSSFHGGKLSSRMMTKWKHSLILSKIKINSFKIL